MKPRACCLESSTNASLGRAGPEIKREAGSVFARLSSQSLSHPFSGPFKATVHYAKKC